ncbi:fused MFS/spermidine synthase [Roseibium sp. MMSF_3544]|uniref:fused MFS/spermidine synthase n=1 Tax=unclassified Roseibium TaxID=2629323 RepID=UPI00273D20F6|nr:fused MFS/spermidine synthase [Roseibium sp. MMSF_3544]
MMQQPRQPSLSANESGRIGVTVPVLQLFAGTLFLSAFLLFSVQPFFSKLVLPKLGGSPGVWSVAMVFFQTVLLLGYAYAHLLTRYLQTKHAILVHTLVLLTACLFLPLGIARGWDTPPAAYQEIWLLGLFAVSVGLPFFAVSANAPLLQAWFTQTGHKHASDPYFLYGASNIGSFASLYLYILVLEPSLTLGSQSLFWTIGYFALVIGILLCAATIFRQPQEAHIKSGAAEKTESSPSSAQVITARQIVTYLALAAVPSALTIALTAHIAVDIASAPFMWVVPLSLFLLTFVIVFKSKPLISVDFLSNILPFMAIIAAAVIFMPKFLPLVFGLGANLLIYFITVLFCHARLYQLRPHASQLTAFYLWMSVGGVLGGIFAGLIAPNVFSWVAEYPMLMLIALFLLPLKNGATSKSVFKTVLFGVALLCVFWLSAARGWLPSVEGKEVVVLSILGLITLAAIVQLKWQPVSHVLLVLTAPLVLLLQLDPNVVHMERSFFGVIKVKDTDDGSHRRMVHGTTVHGSIDMSAFDAETGKGSPVPLAYYHETGEMADTLRAAREGAGGPLGQIGIVGLGTGSFLCHRQDGETWTVYEIDKAVIDVASNPAYFRFISDCGPETRMVLGDARLTLEAEPDRKFDYLLIDAFSSDSIPVHLMTREAIDLFFSKLSADGVLALHISNRYLELASVLAAIAETDGYVIRFAKRGTTKGEERPDQVFESDVVVLARDEADLGTILENPRWQTVSAGQTTPWTDDYSNIVGAIVRHEFGDK